MLHLLGQKVKVKQLGFELLALSIRYNCIIGILPNKYRFPIIQLFYILCIPNWQLFMLHCVRHNIICNSKYVQTSYCPTLAQYLINLLKCISSMNGNYQSVQNILHYMSCSLILSLFFHLCSSAHLCPERAAWMIKHDIPSHHPFRSSPSPGRWGKYQYHTVIQIHLL